MDINLYNEIVSKLKIAIDNGDVQAMVDLADMYFRGPDMNETNIVKAMPYYRMAADSGDAVSAGIVGSTLYYAGIDGIERDVQSAVKYTKIAIEGGVTPALTVLGEIYEEGRYIEQDYQKALHYYTLASEQKDPSGTYKKAALKYKLDYEFNDWFTDLLTAYLYGDEEASEMIDDYIESKGEDTYLIIQTELDKLRAKLGITEE
ncbi:MAG: sel1 repeat family protein [Ruminococcus sp.]|nr:sel1 repeat family protein [Ruminococcus sp.]